MRNEGYTVPETRQVATDQLHDTANFLTAVMTLLVAAAYTKHSEEIPAVKKIKKNAQTRNTL